MKKINLFLLLFSMMFFFSYNLMAQRNLKLSMTIKAGEYSFNSNDLYFFDDGIDCYLLKQCNDVDTVFDNTASKLIVSKDSVIKYQAYLFTDTYEYVYTKVGKNEGWLRVNIPITAEQRKFFKDLLPSTSFMDFSTYVEVVPFKEPYEVFISTTDYWFVGNINKLKSTNIGTKGGRLEACQMIYPKNCIKCYIDLGWGQEVWYDSNGKKIKVK